MKNLIVSSIVILFFNSAASAQCYPDRHNATWFDSWVSCTATVSPNLIRGSSHWIMYDLGQKWALKEMNVWNINAPDILDYGTQTAMIDYSLDGSNWIEYGIINLNQGTGQNNYEGEFVVDLGGIQAEYLLITLLTNYGGSCSGFAELKIVTDISTDVEESLCIKGRVFPNPVTSDQLFLELSGTCSGDNVSYKLINSMGQTLIQNTSIGPYETKEILQGRKLTPGIYFLTLFSDKESAEYKVVIF